MFRLHLPAPIYEHLPKLYLITAAVLALVDLSTLKWVAIVALVSAAGLTLFRRRSYREAKRREALRRYVAERYGKRLPEASRAV